MTRTAQRRYQRAVGREVDSSTRRSACGRTGKTVIAVGGLVLVVLLEIPWLQSVLQKVGVGDPGQLGQVLTVALLVAISFDVRSLLSDENRARSEPTYFSAPMEVCPALLAGIARIKRAEEEQLDVIGMTLCTAWPIHFSKATQASGITVEAYGYDCTPAIHGHQSGTGDLCWSALRWSGDATVSSEDHSYEHVPAEDRSAAAEAERAVFQSWLERSRQVLVEQVFRSSRQPYLVTSGRR